jgi:hypothetical protein
MKYTAVLLALAACGGKPAAPTTTLPGDQPRRLDWSPPCDVPVTELRTGRGHSLEMTYIVHARPAADGVVTIHRNGGRAIRVDGELVPKATVEEQRSIDAIVELPAFDVSMDSRFVRSSGDAENFATLNVHVFVDANGEAGRATAVEFMQSDDFRVMVEGLQRELWTIWVEAWLDGGEPQPGAAAGRVRLRRQDAADAPMLEVETEPSTMRPDWARRTNGPDDVVEYRFDWAHAEGCSR